MITVRFDHSAKDASVKIVDALGQILMTEQKVNGTTFTRTLNSVATSYVIVTVQEGNKKTTKKVLISK